MKCPIDGTELKMAERSGVEIDYCPECRGVWLDRGELDKIIERSTAQTAPPPPPAAARPAHEQDDRRDYGSREGGYREGEYRKKKRGGFLEDLFDF